VRQELSALPTPQTVHPTATSGGLQALGAEEKLDLFRQLDEIGSGVILALEVKGGLPFRLIREVAA
jgi:hypothetical protein